MNLPMRSLADLTSTAVVKTGSATLAATEKHVHANPGAAVAMTLTLAAPATMPGEFVIIQTIGLGAAATVLVTGTGIVSLSLSLLGRSAILWNDGATWYVVAGYLI